MTKADVLDAFDKLEVCTSYKINGKSSKEIPFQMTRVAIEPELQAFNGWKTDISAIKSPKDLPEAAQKYIAFINQYLGVNIAWISNGPGRDQLIEIK